MPVSAISGSRLSLDLNGNGWPATSFLLNCPTHNWALPSPLPSGNWASNKQIFQIYWLFLNFLMRTFFGETQNINIFILFVFQYLMVDQQNWVSIKYKETLWNQNFKIHKI